MSRLNSGLSEQKSPDVAVMQGRWCDMGKIDYGVALDWQHRLVALRSQNLIADVFLLCEHPDVVTLGRRQTAQANVLSDAFPIYHVERGGDATYHGPGQLVGYPIFFFPKEEQDPHQILRKIEQALIEACEHIGIMASRKEGHTGVWTQDQERKIASIGVALRQGVTFHGFALNVSTHLESFQALRPCGLSPQVMTSLQKEGACVGDRPIEIQDVLPVVVRSMEEAFKRSLSVVSKETLLHEGLAFSV